jgi:hypothetical protein
MSQAPRTPKYELTRLQSLDELSSIAAAWDELWWRSEGLFPTARATTVAQCAAQFAQRERVCSLVVSRGDRLLAALPLVGARVKRVLPVGGLAGNAWTPAGDLLVDPDCDVPAVLDTLVSGMAGLPWPLVWLEAAMMDSARWIALYEALGRAGLMSFVQERFAVGRCGIDRHWENYQRGRSRNLRRAMRRATRAADQFGEIGFELHTPSATDKVNRLLRRGFEVEDSGWKGAAGSSVLCNPGMFDFFAHQAQQLAAWGQLAVALLTINGEAIAFEYALAAKGTYAPVKVGYDPRFSEVKPGQLLRWHLLRTLHTEGRWSGVDFVGPISQATARWSTTTYRLCRMVIAPPRFSSRLLLAGYRLAKYRGNVSDTANGSALLAEDRAEPSFAASSAD